MFNPTPDSQLRSFSPDRPPKADSAHTVDAGHFQYETDLLNYSQTNFGGVTTRLYQAADPVWKFGLTNWVDFELQYNGYQNLTATDDATGAVVARGAGFGDVFVKSKINLFGNDGGAAALAVIPYVKIPSGTAVISNGVVEGGLIAPFQLQLPHDFGLTLMSEVDALKDANDGGRHANFVDLVNLNHPVPGIEEFERRGRVLFVGRYRPEHAADLHFRHRLDLFAHAERSARRRCRFRPQPRGSGGAGLCWTVAAVLMVRSESVSKVMKHERSDARAA